MSNEQLPIYTDDKVKSALLAAGASGTVYSLVMPESEAALAAVMDGKTTGATDRDSGLFELYREAWTQKQDSVHELYFDRWVDWAKSVVTFDSKAFPCRYPTAGASEGIFKLMAEYAARAASNGFEPTIHMFHGEYEGFPAYADSLGIQIVRHDRNRWQEITESIKPNGQFWISQPSAIDGAVWPHFYSFANLLAEEAPTVELVPDLTYVGNVATEFTLSLETANIRCFVISHSKPFGGYYHRVGGVFAKSEIPSLFGNKWFKNLLSLKWATTMMERHKIFELPQKYAIVQQEAVRRVGKLLDIKGLEPADINLLATAPIAPADNEFLKSLYRGSEAEQVIRVCLTPSMACLIDPKLAGATGSDFMGAWRLNGFTGNSQ